MPLTPPWENLICCSPRASAATSAAMRFLWNVQVCVHCTLHCFWWPEVGKEMFTFNLTGLNPLRGSLEQRGMTVKLLRGSPLTQGGQVGGFCGSKTGRIEVTAQVPANSPGGLQTECAPDELLQGRTVPALLQLCGCWVDYFVFCRSCFLGLFSEIRPQLKDPPAAAPCWDFKSRPLCPVLCDSCWISVCACLTYPRLALNLLSLRTALDSSSSCL